MIGDKEPKGVGCLLDIKNSYLGFFINSIIAFCLIMMRFESIL